MSAGAVEGALVGLIDHFQRSFGHSVHVYYGTAPELAERLAAGSSADVLIAPVAVMDRAVADNRAVGSTRVTVGRVGIGVIVGHGIALPDLSSPDAVRRAFLAADAIIYNRGSSGLYIEKLFGQMGIVDQVKSRIVQVSDGEDVMKRVIAGKGSEIGLAAISAIKLFEPKDFQYVGPLPNAIQNVTIYDAAVMAGANEPQAAAAFLGFITTPAARETFVQAGLQ
jgi:molybdate transport system substrate-binding protein